MNLKNTRCGVPTEPNSEMAPIKSTTLEFIPLSNVARRKEHKQHSYCLLSKRTKDKKTKLGATGSFKLGTPQ